MTLQFAASYSQLTAIIARVRGGGAQQIQRHLAAYPRDALMLSVAVPTIAFAGVTELPEQAWQVVEELAPAYGNDWWYTGLLAFIRQEQERWSEAAALAAGRWRPNPAPGMPPTLARMCIQREVVEDTLLDALLRADRVAEARALLVRRLDRRPSRRDLCRLSRTRLTSTGATI